MLWSLTKIVIFVIVVGALALGAEYLVDAEGGIQISIPQFGIEANPGALVSVIGLAVLLAVMWLILKAVSFLLTTWRFLAGDETALRRFMSRNREARGMEALTQGMMALATGEGRVALAKAEKAETDLQRPELTSLLKAQAAEMAGDRKKAEETYRKMVENDKTRFIGVRGIMKQKLADGDTETAFKLAEKAFALKPRHSETQDTLLTLQAQKEDWSGARKTLGAKLRHGSLPRDVYKRRDAVLALSSAKSILAEDQTIQAREAAIEANRLSPGLIPAAVMAAQGYIEKGQARSATRILKKAWEMQPHPDLAQAFAAIEPDENPGKRILRFQQLTRIAPEHSETRMLLAELNIAAEDFPAARRALGDLVETEPTVRSATLMAAIERGLGSPDNVVQGWLARAVTAPRGPQWVCENCQHVPGVWGPVCDNCGAFDTLTWTNANQAELSLPGGASMLPLLVGKPTEEEETVVPVPVVDESEEEGIKDVTPEATIVVNGADSDKSEARHS